MLGPANADAPTPLSSVLLLGLHGIGGTTDDMSAYRGYPRLEAMNNA